MTNQCDIRGCKDNAKRILEYVTKITTLETQTKIVKVCMKHTISTMKKHSCSIRDYIEVEE